MKILSQRGITLSISILGLPVHMTLVPHLIVNKNSKGEVPFTIFETWIFIKRLTNANVITKAPLLFFFFKNRADKREL